MEGKQLRWNGLQLLLAFALLQTIFAFPNVIVYDPLITPAPIVDVNLLQKRAADQTCGYVSGDPNSPLVCSGTSTCSFSNYYWGCCDSLSCDRPQTCANIASPYCQGVASDNCVYTQIQRCSDDCVSYVRETGVGDSERYTSWTCGPTATEILVLASPTAAATTAASTGTSSTSPSDTGSSSDSSESSTPTDGASGSSSNDTISTSNSTNGATPTDSPSHAKLSGGAIAGIVVGGVFFCLIVSAVLWWAGCCRRRRSDPSSKTKTDDNNTANGGRTDEDNQNWNRDGRDVSTWLSSSVGRSSSPRSYSDTLVMSDRGHDHDH